jgi:hypothetical protein
MPTTTTPGRAITERPEVPAVDQLVRPRDYDGFVVHDVAILHLPGGKATIRRHVSHDEVLFTGHIEADADLDWIDDDDQADALAELADFVARERRAAREDYQRSRGAAILRHPAGSAL